jgi:ATP-binding protein involved in chromosome partitioning
MKEKKIIAISSGKGGVGKSTIAVNLAFALQSLNFKVGIMDADITAPNIPLMLGIKDLSPEITEGKKIKPVEIHGLSIMSMGILIKDDQPVIWRGPMLHKAIKQFFVDVQWNPDLDYLIIDLPPGTGDAQISVCQTVKLDGAIIVTTPQNVAITDSKKALNMFKNMKINIFGYIENMSYFVAPDTKKKYNIFNSSLSEENLKKLDLKCLGQIPIEINIRESGDSGLQVSNSEINNIFINIAKQIL